MQVRAWCSNSVSVVFLFLIFCCEVGAKLCFSSLTWKAALVCFLMTLQHIGIEFSHRAETDGQASWCMANWENENIHAQNWVHTFSLQQRDHIRYIKEQRIYWAYTWKNKSTKENTRLTYSVQMSTGLLFEKISTSDDEMSTQCPKIFVHTIYISSINA